MRVIIPAAGYATRLFPLTKDFPKHLLEINGQPIVNYILEKISETSIKEIDLITNHLFYPHFQNWLKNLKTNLIIKIIDDGTLNNEDRLGAIGDINFLIERERINEDLLIIAGDNLFEFSLTEFLEFGQKRRKPTIAVYDLKEKKELVKNFGVILLDKEKKVVDFEEKPEKPKSTLVSTFCYFLPKETIKRLKEYADSNSNLDRAGDFIKWLITKENVYGFVFNQPWWDIGNLEMLEEVKLFYSKKV